MQYACIAATKKGARCRNFVEKQGAMCLLHEKLKDEGREVPSAPAPDIILIKIHINPKQIQKFTEFGLSVRDRVLAKRILEAGRIKQAKKFGRNAFAYNQRASSGTPIFGLKGVYQISVAVAWASVLEMGYDISDIYLEREEQGIKRIVIALELGRTGIPFPAKLLELVDIFLMSTWGICVVWANPPNEKGKILHSLKLFRRQAEGFSERVLLFHHGLWAVEPAP